MAKRNTKEELARTAYIAWMHRRELLLGVAGANVYGWLTQLTTGRLAAAGTAMIAGALLAIPRTRQALHRYLEVSRLRRDWTRAVIDSGAHEPHTRSRRKADFLGPRVIDVQDTRSGDLLEVKVGRGGDVGSLIAYQDRIARCLDTKHRHVQEIRVMPDKDRSSRAKVLIVRRDPFANEPPVTWPPLHDGLDNVSVWNPVTVGTCEDGRPLEVKLVGNHILVGGITGGGKSVFLRPLLATAALSKDPCALWLFDAKLVELAPWAPCAQEFVGRDGKRALEVLAGIQQIADHRQQEIVATGNDKIRRSDRLPVHVIVVDELANYAELPEGGKIMTALRDLASRGRALGIVVICATQVPHSDIIDTTLRNQFSTRIAFRCADRHHAGTILGQADVAAAAAEISDRLPGAGYALAETGRWTYFRSVFVGRPDDAEPGRTDDVRVVVEHATARRADRVLAGLVTDQGDAPSLEGEIDQAADQAPDDRVDQAARTSLGDVMAALVEHLDEAPLAGAELARRIGRRPDDRTVRRALAALQTDGRAVRTSDGWIVGPDQG